LFEKKIFHEDGFCTVWLYQSNDDGDQMGEKYEYILRPLNG